jgi:membrane protein
VERARAAERAREDKYGMTVSSSVRAGPGAPVRPRGARARVAAWRVARAAVAAPGWAVRWTAAGLVRKARAVREVSVSTLKRAWNDRILGLSAEAAFWQLLSLPPLLLAVLGTLGYVGGWVGPEAVEAARSQLITLSGRVLTPQVVDAVAAPLVDELLGRGRGEIAIPALVVALWTGSSGTATFVNTVTIAYGQRHLRNAVRSRLLALWLYVCALAIGVVLLPAMVIGPDLIVHTMPDSWRDAAETVVRLTYWPVIALVVFTGLAVLYHASTPVRLHWRRAFPGAALALVLFLLLSRGVQEYIHAVSSHLPVYGTLAAPVLALAMFYMLAFAVLLGAELNATLEERHPYGKARGTFRRLFRRRRTAQVISLEKRGEPVVSLAKMAGSGDQRAHASNGAKARAGVSQPVAQSAAQPPVGSDS